MVMRGIVAILVEKNESQVFVVMRWLLCDSGR